MGVLRRRRGGEFSCVVRVGGDLILVLRILGGVSCALYSPARYDPVKARGKRAI
jgi:hypothetical protein